MIASVILLMSAHLASLSAREVLVEKDRIVHIEAPLDIQPYFLIEAKAGEWEEYDPCVMTFARARGPPGWRNPGTSRRADHAKSTWNWTV